MSDERGGFDYIGGVGQCYTKSSSYEGLTEEEADELKAELDAKASRRVPVGFRAETAKTSRRAGRFPKVRWLS